MKSEVLVACLVILCAVTGLYWYSRYTHVSESVETILAALNLESNGEADLGALPLERAIKVVRGKGEQTLVTFEDPLCAYCARLNKRLAKVDNITIYTFLIPVIADSSEHSRRIWCAPDRGKAWTNWMVARIPLPSVPAGCDTSALDKNANYAEKRDINSVPHILLPRKRP